MNFLLFFLSLPSLNVPYLRVPTIQERVNIATNENAGRLTRVNAADAREILNANNEDNKCRLFGDMINGAVVNCDNSEPFGLYYTYI